jgi:hypothetical protein
MEFDWTQGALADGLRRYNAGEYFTAHEAWETVWLGANEQDKTFLQGLIQVSAAFHHLRRNNDIALLWVPHCGHATFVQPISMAADGEQVFVIGHPEEAQVHARHWTRLRSPRSIDPEFRPRSVLAIVECQSMTRRAI